PFVKDDPSFAVLGSHGSRSFWAVETTGGVQSDCELGRQYANAAVDYMRSEKFSPLLGHIVAGMAQDPRYTEGNDKMIMVGFMGEIARLAAFGRRVIDAVDHVQTGWMTVAYKYPKGDDESESKVLVGNALEIPEPEPLPCIEIRRPFRRPRH